MRPVPDISVDTLHRAVALLAERAGADAGVLQFAYAVDIWVHQSADEPISFEAALGWPSRWAGIRRAERNRRLVAVRDRWFPPPMSDRQAAAGILAAVDRHHRDHGPPTPLKADIAGLLEAGAVPRFDRLRKVLADPASG
jgi:hypothetical protein